MRTISRRLAIVLVGSGLAVGAVTAAAAQNPTEQQILVDRARNTVNAFTAQSDMEQMRQLLAKARGVIIFPQLLKAGFVVGGQGGSGVLLAKDPKTGSWTAPAFYTLGAGSIGLQIGAEASEVMLLIMNEKALTAVINNQVKLGADATIAVGPIGKGVQAATTTALSADIYSFARSKGLFGGVSIEGAVIAARDSWDRAYYGKPVTTSAIVLRREVEAPAAAGLQQALQRSEQH